MPMHNRTIPVVSPPVYLDQAAVPAVKPTLGTDGVATPDLPGLQEAAAVCYDAAAGGEGCSLYAYFDGAWCRMDGWNTPAVAGERHAQAFYVAPRAARYCLRGPAGVTNAKFVFSA